MKQPMSGIVLALLLPLTGAQFDLGSRSFDSVAPPSRPTAIAAFSASSFSSSPITINLVDLSGNGNNGFGPGGSPTWSAGPPPYVGMVSNNFSSVSSLTNPTNTCIYAVLYPTVGQSEAITSHKNSGGNSLEVGLDSGFHPYMNYQGVAVLGTATTALTINTYADVAYCYDGTTATFWLNGSSNACNGSCTNSQTIGQGVDTLFTNATGSNPYTGRWVEVDVTTGPYNSAWHTFFVATYGVP